MTNQELKQLCERVIEEYACNNADGVMLSKGLLRLLAENESMRVVCEAAKKMVICIEDGINVGRYNHLSNGDTAVDNSDWHALNSAVSKLPPEAGE